MVSLIRQHHLINFLMQDRPHSNQLSCRIEGTSVDQLFLSGLGAEFREVKVFVEDLRAGSAESRLNFEIFFLARLDQRSRLNESSYRFVRLQALICLLFHQLQLSHGHITEAALLVCMRVQLIGHVGNQAVDRADVLLPRLNLVLRRVVHLCN